MIFPIIVDWYTFSLALAWALIHSLWQAAVLTGILYFVLEWIKNPVKRYFILLSGFLLVFSLTIFTFWIHYGGNSGPGNPQTEQLSILLEPDSPTVIYSETQSEFSQNYLADRIRQILPLIAIIWAIGLFILLVRWVSGLWYLRQLKKWSFSIENELWKRVKTNIEQKAAISISWNLRCSSHVSGPVLIGWIRPVVLIPIGMINGLAEEEVEAIIAHELAHLIRRDFPVNLLQTFIETLFYFNPAMQILSKWISEEREHCCDDLAVHTTQRPLIYAKTLLKAGALSNNEFSPILAQALKSPNKSLFVRVERILFHKHKKNNIMVRSMTALLMLILSVVFLLAAGLPVVNSSKESLSKNHSQIADYSAANLSSSSKVGDAKKQLSQITVDTLIIVDPATFKQERFLRTTITGLQIPNEKESKLDFSVVAYKDQKEQIRDLAIAFKTELTSSGLMERGSNQVILNKNDFKINNREQSNSAHRKMLKKYQDQLEGFHEIWLSLQR